MLTDIILKVYSKCRCSIKYIGGWKDGKYHGYGEILYSNGSRYLGLWKDNRKHGKGSFIYPDGHYDEGVWNNGELQEKF